MNSSGRDNIVIGLMIILSYYLIYAFLGNSFILRSMGGLPLVNCTTDIIRNGFSASTVSALTTDFGQTVIVVFIVVFVQNIVPEDSQRSGGRILLTILGYIILYVLSMWIVRNVIFSDKTGEVLRMFIAIFSVVIGGLGAIFASPLGRIITRSDAEQTLRNNLYSSRPVQWLANAFYITTAILFLAVVIEMVFGLEYFFSVMVASLPSFIVLILYFIGLYALLLGGFRRK